MPPSSGFRTPYTCGTTLSRNPTSPYCAPRDDFYTQSHPTPEDILLVVEVADSSRDYDRQVKVPMYAEAGIVETWVVDLVSETVEVYRQPTPEGYWQTVILGPEDLLSPAALPDLELDLSQLLGALG